MKLIYARGACSLAVHLMLEELGYRYEAQEVSLKDKTELEKYNEHGYVPVLVLDSGEKITEAITILQYLAEHFSRTDLLPEIGTFERTKCLQWLTFLSTEVHKSVGPLFHPEILTEAFVSKIRDKVEERLSSIDRTLTKNKFLLENQFSIADMYCLAILRIVDHVGIKLNKFPNIMTYKLMLEEMPMIRKVISEEDRAGSQTKAA